MGNTFEYIFPSIKGIQAGREYYISMCPLKIIPKIFLFNEEELRPDVRAQRSLNKARVPEIAHYMLDNKNDYVFSALTASIDSEVNFEPVMGHSETLGRLHVPMSAKFIINDGQHRRAAIEMALNEKPELGDETIAVVFFLDVGLDRCQQMFADLNRYAVRPSKSIGVLYDYRDRLAMVTKKVIFKSSVFQDIVEMERTTLPQRSRKLFTLSAIYSANKVLLREWVGDLTDEELVDKAIVFWDEVGKNMKDWEQVRNRKILSGHIRQDYIHSHGITLQALGYVGSYLLNNNHNMKSTLKKLKNIDWRRSKTEEWEGRALVGGRVSKATYNVILTVNKIKEYLGLPLTPEEQKNEDIFQANK